MRPRPESRKLQRGARLRHPVSGGVRLCLANRLGGQNAQMPLLFTPDALVSVTGPSAPPGLSSVAASYSGVYVLAAAFGGALIAGVFTVGLAAWRRRWEVSAAKDAAEDAGRAWRRQERRELDARFLALLAICEAAVAAHAGDTSDEALRLDAKEALRSLDVSVMELCLLSEAPVSRAGQAVYRDLAAMHKGEVNMTDEFTAHRADLLDAMREELDGGRGVV